MIMNKNNVTRKELSTSITLKLGIPYRHSSKIVDIVFSNLKNTLVSWESIKLVNFGSFIVHKKSPRRGRNPQTGESMMITKRHMITFRPSKQLRESLNI